MSSPPSPEPSPRPAREGFLERNVDRIVLAAALAVVVLPTWLAEVPSGGISVRHVPVETPRIDIRTAPWYEWTLLEGIGEARARAIVRYRDERGGFTSIEDLAKVPRMPAGWLEKARPFLSAGDGEDPGDAGRREPLPGGE